MLKKYDYYDIYCELKVLQKILRTVLHHNFFSKFWMEAVSAHWSNMCHFMLAPQE